MKNALKLIIEAIRVAMDKVSWNTLKDRPFYEEFEKVDIAGATYTISINDYKESVPLELGQVWQSERHHYRGGWMPYTTFEVKQDIDGTLYLGSPTLTDDEGGTIIYLTKDEFKVPSGMSSQGYDSFRFTCSSGFATETVVHKLDRKNSLFFCRKRLNIK